MTVIEIRGGGRLSPEAVNIIKEENATTSALFGKIKQQRKPSCLEVVDAAGDSAVVTSKDRLFKCETKVGFSGNFDSGSNQEACKRVAAFVEFMSRNEVLVDEEPVTTENELFMELFGIDLNAKGSELSYPASRRAQLIQVAQALGYLPKPSELVDTRKKV